MDCNKTEIFFKELDRMCNKYRCTKYNASCSGCEIYQHCYDSSCYGFVKNNPLKAVEIVQKWSDSNPVKTRLSMFLKLFPNAKITDGHINICPKLLNTNFEPCPAPAVLNCSDCKKEYWLSEVEQNDKL